MHLMTTKIAHAYYMPTEHILLRRIFSMKSSDSAWLSSGFSKIRWWWKVKVWYPAVCQGACRTVGIQVSVDGSDHEAGETSELDLLSDSTHAQVLSIGLARRWQWTELLKETQTVHYIHMKRTRFMTQTMEKQETKATCKGLWADCGLDHPYQ